MSCITVSILLLTLLNLPEFNVATGITCGDGAQITDIRIENCEDLENCKVKVGQNQSIEVDFSFEKPQMVDKIYLRSSLSYWGKPEESFYNNYDVIYEYVECSGLIQGKCSASTPEKQKMNTIKSNIYIDPETIDKRFGTNKIMRDTLTDLEIIRTVGQGHLNERSYCFFSLSLNIEP